MYHKSVALFILKLFFWIHRKMPIYLEPPFYMFLLSRFMDICFATPFICTLFEDTNIIIQHFVPYSKMFLNPPFCTSALCHINSPNLAPTDLKPLCFDQSPICVYIYINISMFLLGYPSCYWAAKKSPFPTISSQGISAKCVSSQIISITVFLFLHYIPWV